MSVVKLGTGALLSAVVSADALGLKSLFFWDWDCLSKMPLSGPAGETELSENAAMMTDLVDVKKLE